MDAGTIIFYLVIIVFIISRIRRAIKESEKGQPEKAVPKSGWKKALSDVMTEIQKGMEEASEGGKSTSADREVGWEDIAVPVEYQTGYPDGPAEEAPVFQRATPQPENPRERKPSAKMEEIQRKIEEIRGHKSGISTECSVVPGMPDERDTGPVNPLPRLPDQLQAAIAWSEILAPPLALREVDR
ncbi:MAG: hypothetical protein GXP53_10775 [Deltaproteobacteria bacterium]|nr:hypothetical protein [Deltaproteobacteria bacterium]